MPAKQPRVALCIGGALRHFNISWTSIQRNVVEPTRAHVYMVISNQASEFAAPTRYRSMHTGFRPRSPGATDAANIETLQLLVGPALRGVVVWGEEELRVNAIARWAGAAAANASNPTLKGPYAWRYYLKLWAAQLLAANAAVRYDIAVMMRPDIFFFRPWHFAFDGPARFSLQVAGEAAVRFGDNEVVVHSFGHFCHNDWVAIATLGTSTAVAQLIHHAYSAANFAPCPALRDYIGGERLMGAYLWRVGVTRQVVDLHVDMTRILQEHEANSRHYARRGVTKVAIWDYYPMWVRNQSHLYERAFRRTANRSGLAARNAGDDRWGWYCSDPTFVDFSDSFVLAGSTQRLADRTTVSFPAPLRANIGSSFPACMLALEEPHTCHRTAVYPACSSQVELQGLLTPCVRHSLQHRISPTDRSQQFAWWRSCSTPSNECDPIPNVTLIAANGLVQPNARLVPQRG